MRREGREEYRGDEERAGYSDGARGRSGMRKGGAPPKQQGGEEWMRAASQHPVPSHILPPLSWVPPRRAQQVI